MPANIDPVTGAPIPPTLHYAANNGAPAYDAVNPAYQNPAGVETYAATEAGATGPPTTSTAAQRNVWNAASPQAGAARDARVATMAPGRWNEDQMLGAIMNSGAGNMAGVTSRINSIWGTAGTQSSDANSMKAYNSIADGQGSPFSSAISQLRQGKTPEQIMAMIPMWVAQGENPANINYGLADLQRAQQMLAQYGLTSGNAGSPQWAQNAQQGNGIVNQGIGASGGGAGGVNLNDPNGPQSDPNPGSGAQYPVTDPRHWGNYPSQFPTESQSTDPNIVNALALMKAGKTDSEVFQSIADLQGKSPLFWQTEIAKMRAGLPPGYAPAPPGGSGGGGGGGDTGGGIVNSGTGQFAPPNVDYQPVLGEVQGNQTVQGQLKDILTNGNPLLEGAKARAIQAANARGLQNSSMASQAGEEAIVNTALPIAQQDAATYQKQALTNQDISNQFLSTKMGAQLDLVRAYEAFKQNNFMWDKDEKLKRYISDSGNSSQEKIAALQAAAKASDNSSQERIAAAQIDGRLKEAGLTIEANKLLSDMGFTHQQALALTQNQQNMIVNYSGQLNAIQMADIDQDKKAEQIRQLNIFWSSVPNFPIHINIDTLPPINNGGGGGGGGGGSGGDGGGSGGDGGGSGAGTSGDSGGGPAGDGGGP